VSWRDHLPIHPAAELFPLMSKDELRELADDIGKHGLHEPITLDAEDLDRPSVLDGRNRLDALELLGRLKMPATGGIPYRRRLGTGDPYAYVISKNIHRRHLTSEQKRELIAKVLKARPEASDRQIAKQVKADHKTVGKARKRLVSRGEIPHVETRTDTKGRVQPAHRSRKKALNFEPIAQSVVEVAIEETDEERHRKECVALFQKVHDAQQERAQWLWPVCNAKRFYPLGPLSLLDTSEK